MNTKIAITGIASVSPLGSTPQNIWESYKKLTHQFLVTEVDGQQTYTAPLSKQDKQILDGVRNSDPKYKPLDDTVIMALAVSRKAVAQACWSKEAVFGINFGSSRGATALFEKEHEAYLTTRKANVLASPTTTLGNISSWVCHDLQTTGPEVSHSITCSTALHSLLNGVAWLRSGMVNQFLVGGSEAPLTPFTIAQMKALKIYAPITSDPFPCKALDLEKSKNTMILGEGAGAICLENGEKENALAYIIGVGYATEILKHNISISSDAQCFQKSMRMALKEANLTTVDVIVMHAPGTIKGDISEYEAIKKVFDQLPSLTTNKWKLGHTFGSSGMFSLELAILMLQHQEIIESPFYKNPATPNQIKSVMVNAVGFGGNAVSVIVGV